ncbi:MAG: hypothetical protein M5U23_10185 [Acidimicrobiia bacterium]|nr:hypothetical protein [Acidimicrobiia bacterium]
MKLSLHPRLLLLVALIVVTSACTGGRTSPTTATSPDASTTTAPTPETTVAQTTTTLPPLAHRIGTRIVDGVGEFYDTVTAERFVPRGVNYVDFQPNPAGGYEDRVFATNTYDAERVREAFRTLATNGYNTARIFVDTCGAQPECIANYSGQGLNDEYLDNIAEVMHIAGEEGIWLLLTANSLPDVGGYWQIFDSYYNQGHEGFDGRENADWLHTGGVEAKAVLWDGLLSGLVDRGAPFEVLLGWQLTNEFWLHKNFEPLSLTSGVVETANGRTYDMADAEQKRRMVVDGVVYFIDRIREVIDAYDPDTLVTMGFFTPQFPHQTYIGGDWYVDTAPLLTEANLDFFDFHAYYDTDLTVPEHAENFGMPGHQEKPVLMGETGSGKATVPSARAALGRGYRFIAESCEAGWDGWLNWGYYVWPDDQPGPAWAFLDSDGLLLEAFSPNAQPDPCVVPPDAPFDLTTGTTPRVSRSELTRPAKYAVDDSLEGWGSGDYPPQWIAIDFDQPSTVVEIGLGVDQWPPGISHHQVWATLSDGREVLVADIERFTGPEMLIGTELNPGLTDVVSVRVETLASTSWVSWREIEVISAASTGSACLVDGGPIRVAPSNEAATVAGTKDVTALVEARYLGDPQWLRLPGDRWILATADLCPDLPVVDGPRLDLVEVTIEVEVPSGSGEVFVPGAFGAGIPVWNPWSVLVLPTDQPVQSVTMLLPRNSVIAYTYTRGEWDTVERDAACQEMSRRTFVASDGLVIHDAVANWADRC